MKEFRAACIKKSKANQSQINFITIELVFISVYLWQSHSWLILQNKANLPSGTLM
jgi:hypothetical protein